MSYVKKCVFILFFIFFAFSIDIFALEECNSIYHCFELGLKGVDNLNSTNATYYFLTAEEKGNITLEHYMNLSTILYHKSLHEECNKKKALLHLFSFHYFDFVSSIYLEFVGENKTIYDKARYPTYFSGIISYEGLLCFYTDEYQDTIVEELGDFTSYEGLSTQSVSLFKLSKSINENAGKMDTELDSNITRNLLYLESIGINTSLVDVQPKKKDGHFCYDDLECFSENCQQNICCEQGQYCCTSRVQCGLNEFCNKTLHYCVVNNKTEETSVTPTVEITKDLKQVDNSEKKEIINENKPANKTTLIIGVISILFLIIYSLPKKS